MATRQPSPPEDTGNPRRVEFTHDHGVLGISLDPDSEDLRKLDDPDDRAPFENFKQKAFYRIEVRLFAFCYVPTTTNAVPYLVAGIQVL